MVIRRDLQRLVRNICESPEPDTKGEVDLDDITGTDKSQQVTPQAPKPETGGQEPQPQEQPPEDGDGGFPTPPNLDDGASDSDPKDMEKDSAILSGMKGHPYIQSFSGSDKSKLNPINLVNMDKDALVTLKAQIDEMMSLKELKQKIGLYQDKTYQTLLNLKSFVEDIISKK